MSYANNIVPFERNSEKAAAIRILRNAIEQLQAVSDAFFLHGGYSYTGHVSPESFWCGYLYEMAKNIRWNEKVGEQSVRFYVAEQLKASSKQLDWAESHAAPGQYCTALDLAIAPLRLALEALQS
jgi:hypothetical protein